MKYGPDISFVPDRKGKTKSQLTDKKRTFKPGGSGGGSAPYRPPKEERKNWPASGMPKNLLGVMRFK